MKKSGIIFDAKMLRVPGVGTLLSLVIMSLLLFFSYQKFVTPISHTAHAQSYMYQIPQNINQAPQGSMQVTIQNMQFMPSQMTIPEGTVVTWSNQDTVAHTTTSDNGFWNSGVLQPGQSFSRMFTTPGTYTYHCNIHPFMHGTIVVTRRVAPPAPVTPYTPPSTSVVYTPQPIMYNPPMAYSAPAAPTTYSAMQSQSQSQSITSSSSTNVNMQQSQSQSQSLNY